MRWMTKDGWVFGFVDTHWFRFFKSFRFCHFWYLGENQNQSKLLFLVISKPLKEPTVFMEEPIKNQVVIKGYKEPSYFDFF
jgi:hypothetical protein